MNFVDLLLEYTEDAESPTSYFKWAAYTTLATIMRDNVWIDRKQYGKIYPNIYTLILSRRSSLVRKSLPLKVALKLVQQIDNTKVVNGRATIPGIIKVLAAPKMSKEGKTVDGASAMLYSEELSAMLIDGDTEGIHTLTDWYDYHEKWNNTLSSTDVISLENVCITMLVSSNEALVRELFNVKASQGGLLARTFLILEGKKRHKNSLMYPEDKQRLDGKLVAHLRQIAAMRGEMHLTDDARQYHHEWYHNFEPLDSEMSSTGIEGRLQTHILKLSMLLSAADGPTQMITLLHMEEATLLAQGLIKNYEMMASGAGDSPLSRPGKELIMLLYEQPDKCLAKSKILWKMWAEGVSVVDSLLETLVQAEIVECHTDSRHIFTVYLTDRAIESLGGQTNDDHQTEE